MCVRAREGDSLADSHALESSSLSLELAEPDADVGLSGDLALRPGLRRQGLGRTRARGRTARSRRVCVRLAHEAVGQLVGACVAEKRLGPRSEA